MDLTVIVYLITLYRHGLYFLSSRKSGTCKLYILKTVQFQGRKPRLGVKPRKPRYGFTVANSAAVGKVEGGIFGPPIRQCLTRTCLETKGAYSHESHRMRVKKRESVSLSPQLFFRAG